MARLTPCPSCHSHVLVEDRECPHCGAELRTTGAPRVAAAVMGLALGGCIIDAEPAYGIPDPTVTTGSESTAGTSHDTDATDSMTSGGTTGSESGSTSTADSSGTDATAGSSSVGEPDYGVPGTTSG